jgi:beta-glucosidase
MTISVQVAQLEIQDTSMSTIVFGHQYTIGTPQPWYPFDTVSHTRLLSIRLYLKTNATVKDTLTASVDVTNASPVDGTEVVQLYIVDTFASVDVPNRKPKAF